MSEKTYDELLQEYEEDGTVPQQILIPNPVTINLSMCPHCKGKFYTEHSDIHCPYCCMELFGIIVGDREE